MKIIRCIANSQKMTYIVPHKGYIHTDGRGDLLFIKFTLNSVIFSISKLSSIRVSESSLLISQMNKSDGLQVAKFLKRLTILFK